VAAPPGASFGAASLWPNPQMKARAASIVAMAWLLAAAVPSPLVAQPAAAQAADRQELVQGLQIGRGGPREDRYFFFFLSGPSKNELRAMPR
jgi:hypothetical protein